jgi:hypothetical protein
MTTILLVVAVFMFLTGVLFFGLHGFVWRTGGAPDLATQLKPVNIDALKNLLDPAQDIYLSKHLGARELRMVRRERALVLIEYVWLIAQNAATVLEAAELARKSPNTETVAEGARMANLALRVRLAALYGLWRLTLTWIWPGRLVGTSIVDGYSALSGDIQRLRQSVL